jgi:YVTN family beta-propeller protein
VRNLGSVRTRRRRRGRVAIAAALTTCVAVVGVASAAIGRFFDPFGNQQVSQTYANGVLLPTDQWISPLGTRILDNTERLVSSTISPDGRYLAALGWNDFSGYLTIFDLQTGKMVSQTGLATGTGTAQDYSVAADGPLFSSDGKTIWVPQSTWLAKFSFDPSTGAAAQEDAIALCGSALTSPACNPNIGPSNANGAWLPSGMALSPDGNTLYVALNGNNTLGVVNTQTDTLTARIPVGNAPRQVVLADNGTVAYVSNEGGRPATSHDFTNLSDGTPIVSSRSTGGAITGTVSVVNLTTGKETQEIPVGLQPTALYQDGNALFVANSNDDSLSVIDENSNRVTQTVQTNPVPGAQVGSYANAINMSDPNHVLVSIGRDNAIAVYRYNGLYGRRMRLIGLLPTDWYPVQVQPDPALGANTIVVTNDKGIGAQGPASTINKGYDTTLATGHNTYDDTGSVTTFTMPADYQIGQDTQTVFTDDDWNQIKPINQGDYDSVPKVIPAHLGGSSPIKHIVVIVKENRTYDQVLGDLKEGNGDPADAQFGEQVTPNQHALAYRFGDLDNFYDEGTLSADGHNWLVQAEANDYVEKEFGAFYRSYPSQGGDSLAYQRDGFLWNAAEQAGRSVQNFGEYIYNPYSLPATGQNGVVLDWDHWYAESQWLEDGHTGPEPIPNPCQYTRVHSDIPSLQAISYPCFPNFQLAIPDQYRVDQWEPVFQRQEQTGNMPNLTFMWLMTDHTGATGVANSNTEPDPVAQAADNDLAVGRVIDQISHSRFWKSTAIFIVEDDTQNGVDHVDGHRGPAFVISPYSASGVDDDYYTQINMVKTIEQILGIHAMNQEDLAAEPMYSAFTQHPDDAPYNLTPNQIPLNLGAPGGPTMIGASSADRKAFAAQGVVPANMRSVYDAWTEWSAQQVAEHHFDGPDRVNPQLMNRFDWYSAHDWRVAYPGDPKIYLPNQVPGRNLPAAFLGDD